MPTISTGATSAIELPAQWILTAAAASNSAGRILRLRDDEPAGGPISLAANETKSVGPYAITSSHHVICEAGSVSYQIGPETVTSSDVQHIVKLTQTAYDALSTPDAATLYVIVG